MYTLWFSSSDAYSYLMEVKVRVNSLVLGHLLGNFCGTIYVTNHIGICDIVHEWFHFFTLPSLSVLCDL